MNANELQNMVLRLVLTQVAKAGEYFVPVNSSGRHVHLSQGDVERLFGPGHQLTKMRDLLQPGQYACQETVMLETPKGKTSLRVVGPARKETQIELSYTDCFKLGLEPVLRMSGETADTPGCVLSHGDKRVTLPKGIIVAKRHLHMSPEEAAAYGLKDGDSVTLLAEGPRATRLENLVVRSGKDHSLEAHIDKDEANACGLVDGQLCRIFFGWAAGQRNAGPSGLSGVQSAAPSTVTPVLHTYVPQAAVAPQYAPQAATHLAPQPASYSALQPASQPSASGQGPSHSKTLDLTHDPHCFLSEEAVAEAAASGYQEIRYAKGAIITPLARDMASGKGIELSQT